MIRSRTSLVRTTVTALAAVAFAACSAGAPVSPAPSEQVSIASASPAPTAAGAEITLRLANPEDPDRPSQPFLDRFVSEVAKGSGGSMAVSVIYHAGGDDDVPKEQVVAGQVIAGDVEMALVPTRSWSDVGVTSLQALMAPFLIDNDALLTAVTTDPLVQPMLDGMTEQGLVGLTVWPEDLRHPFTFEKNGPPLVSPADFKGQTLWVRPSDPQAELVKTLGATMSNVVHLEASVSDGSLRGAESGLWTGAYGLGSMPVATGDVALYPKIQVLVVEDAAWNRLSAEQQGVITSAAIAARDLAIEDHPSDADLARKYCDAGGKVVLAGPADVAKFMVAAKPIYDRLESDPLTATAIDAIRALKASTTASAAIACGPKESATATIPPVEPGPPATFIPDGTYQQVLTKEDLVARGAGTSAAGNNAGTWTLELKGSQGSWTLRHPTGDLETCPLTQSIESDLLRLTFAQSCYSWIDFRWTLEGDQLALTSLDHASGLKVELVNDDAIFGGPWTKVE